jgi:hypothetical protein
MFDIQGDIDESDLTDISFTAGHHWFSTQLVSGNARVDIFFSQFHATLAAGRVVSSDDGITVTLHNAFLLWLRQIAPNSDRYTFWATVAGTGGSTFFNRLPTTSTDPDPEPEPDPDISVGTNNEGRGFIIHEGGLSDLDALSITAGSDQISFELRPGDGAVYLWNSDYSTTVAAGRAVDGSINVTLFNAFLTWLRDRHPNTTFTFSAVVDGDTVTATFNVPPPTTATAPKTGDIGLGIMFVFIVAGVGGASFAGLKAICSKRKK